MCNTFLSDRLLSKCVLFWSGGMPGQVCVCVERRERKAHADVGIEVHWCVCECVKCSGFCHVYVRHIRVYIYQMYVYVF